MITHQPYPSDVSDAEWEFVLPYLCLLPEDAGQREHSLRDVFDALRWLVRSGAQWRYIPKDLPPKSTVYRYFCDWAYDGVLDRIHHTLYVTCREKLERDASPTAAIIDSQSVKSAEKGGPASIRTALMRAS